MFQLRRRWTSFWVKRSGLTPTGRVASRLATLFVPPYKGQVRLARLNVRGFVSPSAAVHHDRLVMGRNVYIGDRVVIYNAKTGGEVRLGDGVALYSDIVIETCDDGGVSIGEETHVQPRCSIIGCKGSVYIGKRVEIASNCAFYPYNHAIVPGVRIREQPLVSRGDIHVGDDAWLGYGVIVLDGVRIGAGAVIGAGSVVTRDIPPEAIAMGVPARVVGSRSGPDASAGAGQGEGAGGE